MERELAESTAGNLPGQLILAGGADVCFRAWPVLGSGPGGGRDLQWWLVRTKSLGDCVLAHAVTNLGWEFTWSPPDSGNTGYNRIPSSRVHGNDGLRVFFSSSESSGLRGESGPARSFRREAR